MIQVDVVMPRLFAEGPGELNVKLDLQSGELTAIVGPSGSGKTTLLRLLAGLETPKQGRIVVDQSVWLDTQLRINQPPQQRPIGYVFQDTALFPNMTVQENIQYAAPKNQQSFVQELIDLTGLETFVKQKPALLSGGQRQRVALARALVRRPKLLLLDEPFAALDEQASQTLRQVLGDLHRRWQTTTLLVSHHAIDVHALANRVVRLVQGRITSDERMDDTYRTASAERIVRIEFNEEQQLWQVETTSTTLQSSNSVWALRSAGDWVDL